ncbi:MAG: hypothetical protein KGQ49_03285 [Verrucomicrobia bacterium]|nr:hypothetical protein [Verrucomicrobiota bacterium]MBU6446405.1 hypothetical protein [Verrucomicrobiota bacterium]MDE3047545.1 hypothetical protein [Verrucomicrobiota bacterium]
MKSLLYRLFIHHWPRKLLALVLAIIVWMVVNRSLTITKVVPNISVRIANIPQGKTIEGMQIDGTLSKRVTLSLNGQKAVLDEISAKDLQIVIDAKDKPQEWIAAIHKKNLVSLNPDIDINKHIAKVAPIEMIIRQSKLVAERIPVSITPIGEVPKGYQLLDIYPYQLFMTVNGPEDAVKRLKARGLKLPINLNDVTQEELDQLQSAQGGERSDEISYFVPDLWKKVSLPLLSEAPIQIDDPQAKELRIDFSRQDLIPIGFSIPVTVFFPPKYSKTLNPETYTLATSDFIVKKNGIKVINTPLYAYGVSRHFLETVKDMVQVVIVAGPTQERETLLWNVQFMYPQELENRYVSKVLSESNDIAYEQPSHLLEDYLRNRFRNYMSRFRLYTPDHHKLSLKIELKANAISITPQNTQ